MGNKKLRWRYALQASRGIGWAASRQQIGRCKEPPPLPDRPLCAERSSNQVLGAWSGATWFRTQTLWGESLKPLLSFLLYLAYRNCIVIVWCFYQLWAFFLQYHANKVPFMHSWRPKQPDLGLTVDQMIIRLFLLFTKHIETNHYDLKVSQTDLGDVFLSRCRSEKEFFDMDKLCEICPTPWKLPVSPVVYMKYDS